MTNITCVVVTNIRRGGTPFVYSFPENSNSKAEAQFVECINKFLGRQLTQEEIDNEDPVDNSLFNSNTDDDELYEDAKKAVIEAGRASTSYIQRKLRIGYSRAARLIDMLEEKGVIGPANGASPREILED